MGGDREVDVAQEFLNWARARSRWILANLGACPKCMRTSFLAALWSAIVAGGMVVAAPGSLWAILSATGAGGLVLLWIAHLVAFGIRTSRGMLRARRGLSGVSPAVPYTASLRREFLHGALQAFGFAAIATVFPGAVSAQETETACTVTSCSGPCQCAPPYSSCQTCASNGEVGCFLPGVVLCCSPYLFWSCPAGSNCNGDGSDPKVEKCR
jgi:hypothetical protein